MGKTVLPYHVLYWAKWLLICPFLKGNFTQNIVSLTPSGIYADSFSANPIQRKWIEFHLWCFKTQNQLVFPGTMSLFRRIIQITRCHQFYLGLSLVESSSQGKLDYFKWFFIHKVNFIHLHCIGVTTEIWDTISSFMCVRLYLKISASEISENWKLDITGAKWEHISLYVIRLNWHLNSFTQPDLNQYCTYIVPFKNKYCTKMCSHVAFYVLRLYKVGPEVINSAALFWPKMSMHDGSKP